MLQGTLCMPVISSATSATSLRYFHQDNLGSLAAITDEAGNVVERLAYDPWGRRRNANGTQDASCTLIGQTTERGYTLHEHLDDVGIIHMNGRLYDPMLGRMMSADPYIQAPGNLQSYNRYSYVMNNPMVFTDPSGYTSLFGKLMGFMFCPICVKEWQKPIATIAIAYFTGQWATVASNSVIIGGAVGGFAGGFSGAAINGANFDQSMHSGIVGGITGAGFGWAGMQGGNGIAGANSAERYIAHALVGCVSSVASGGGLRAWRCFRSVWKVHLECDWRDTGPVGHSTVCCNSCGGWNWQRDGGR